MLCYPSPTKQIGHQTMNYTSTKHILPKYFATFDPSGESRSPTSAAAEGKSNNQGQLSPFLLLSENPKGTEEVFMLQMGEISDDT